MRRFYCVTAIFTAVCLAGCQTHQDKVDALQREHDHISQQYQKDCAAEYLKAQPQFNQKCIEEQKQMDDAWKRLQAEKAKR